MDMDIDGLWIWYQINGWRKTDGTPVRDWKAAVREWGYLMSQMCVEDVMKLEDPYHPLWFASGRWRYELIVDEGDDGTRMSPEEFQRKWDEVGERWKAMAREMKPEDYMDRRELWDVGDQDQAGA